MRGNRPPILDGPREPLNRSAPTHSEPLREVDDEGTVRYLRPSDRALHRVASEPGGSPGPAVINVDGTKEWWVEGKRHRVDGPAYIGCGGNHMEWYIDGKRHRKGKPAVMRDDGARQWWVNGELLRHSPGTRDGASKNSSKRRKKKKKR
jgi:hypothetical protein